jgi:hypothetical protein
MKLSNKILIGFFGFAFIYLTAVFAEFRLRGTPNNINNTNSISETVDISGVSYLVIQDLNQDIAVVGSDQPRLEVRSISGNLLNRLKYNISGDTLTLSEFQPEEKRMVSISVFVPEAVLKGMTVNDSRANVKGLKQELLYISQNAGQIFMSDNKIDKVHLEVSSKSYLHITATSLDTLSTKIDNSQVIISSPVGVLTGSMENHSSLQMNRIDEIQFKKDESSRLHLNQ